MTPNHLVLYSRVGGSASHINILNIMNSNPPTSSERRACETTAKPCLPDSKPKPRTTHASSSPAAQPRMTHACSSPGWMVQNLINYSSIGATAPPSRGPAGVHRTPQAFRAGKPRAPTCSLFVPLGPQIDAPACKGVPNSSLEHPV